jgi:hypothetical protein
MKRNSAQQPVTRKNAEIEAPLDRPIAKIWVEGEMPERRVETTVALSLAECAALAPLLRYAESQYRRNGLATSTSERRAMRRLEGAAAHLKELATLIPTATAARMLGVSEQRVRFLCAKGWLTGKRVRRRGWLIERDSIMRWIEGRRQESSSTAAVVDTSPAASEVACRRPDVRQDHLREWTDETGNDAVANVAHLCQQQENEVLE